MEIAQVRPSDTDLIQAARELFREYEVDLGVDLCFQSFEEELRDLPGLYAPPRGTLLMALTEDGAAGCVAIRPLEEDVCEMKRLYVRPIYRHQGFGDALVSRLLHDATTLGYRRMRLDTLRRLESAIRLYERHGFYETPPYCPNPLPDVLYMEKAL